MVFLINPIISVFHIPSLITHGRIVIINGITDTVQYKLSTNPAYYYSY